jgi:hypothetical protein
MKPSKVRGRKGREVGEGRSERGGGEPSEREKTVRCRVEPKCTVGRGGDPRDGGNKARRGEAQDEEEWGGGEEQRSVKKVEWESEDSDKVRGYIDRQRMSAESVTSEGGSEEERKKRKNVQCGGVNTTNN